MLCIHHAWHCDPKRCTTFYSQTRSRTPAPPTNILAKFNSKTQTKRISYLSGCSSFFFFCSLTSACWEAIDCHVVDVRHRRCAVGRRLVPEYAEHARHRVDIVVGGVEPDATVDRAGCFTAAICVQRRYNCITSSNQTRYAFAVLVAWTLRQRAGERGCVSLTPREIVPAAGPPQHVHVSRHREAF